MKSYTSEDIFQHISKVMQELFELSESEITRESHLSEDLGLDSIDAIDLVAQLQTFVGQRLEPEDFKTVRTVGDVVVLAEKIVNSQNSNLKESGNESIQ